MNVKEKIVICLDLSSEMCEKDLKSSEGGLYERLFHIKRAIRMFVNLKSQMNFKHEYALMVLQENALWLEDFTNDPTEFVERLDYLNQTVNCVTADLNSVFNVILQSVKLPELDNQQFLSQPDEFVLRIIVIYGRSNCVPVFDKSNETFIKLSTNPNIFIDALYVHDINTSDAIKQTNLKLCELDVHEKSYILNTIWRLHDIYNDFSQLIAHPFQRINQSNANYNLKTHDENEEVSSPSVISRSTEKTIKLEKDITEHF